MIHKLQAMNFTKAKIAVITICLLTDFLHGCIAWVLLALVHSTKPAKFNSQRVQPGNVAIHPRSTRNRDRQTPIVWHQIFVRFNHVTPTGALVGQVGGRNDIGYAEYGIYPAYG